uniref:Uncharacterized protein n=1 Tax=Anopheles darlingi TaxID=43151 RepID=A0A2M4DF12_ANODA
MRPSTVFCRLKVLLVAVGRKLVLALHEANAETLFLLLLSLWCWVYGVGATRFRARQRENDPTTHCTTRGGCFGVVIGLSFCEF